MMWWFVLGYLLGIMQILTDTVNIFTYPCIVLNGIALVLTIWSKDVK